MTAAMSRKMYEALTGGDRTGLAGHSPFSFRAAALICLSFLPYAAIPAGQNTNIPLASLIAILYLNEMVKRPRVLAIFLVVACTPLVAFFLQNLVGTGHGSVRSLVAWPVMVLPFAGAACAVATACSTVVLSLRVMLTVSAAYTLVQKLFLDRGTIPFLWWYDLPGYWSVPDNADVIATYIRRPFGWFPEPSFMAGTLALGSIALLLLSLAATRRVRTIDLGIIGLVAAAMFLGRSGSALFSLPALAVLALLPYSSTWRRMVFLVLGLGGSVGLGLQLITARRGATNASWEDRASSIIAGIRYLMESSTTMLVGVGRGGATVIYDQGAVSIEGLPVTTRLVDIFSVSGRLLLENGVIGGMLILLILLVPLVRAQTIVTSLPFALVAAGAWLIVITLTITYDSAVWLWMLPGVSVGLLGFATSGRDRPYAVVGRAGPGARTEGAFGSPSNVTASLP